MLHNAGLLLRLEVRVAELSRGRALFLLLMMMLCLPGCPRDPDVVADAGEVEDAVRPLRGGEKL